FLKRLLLATRAYAQQPMRRARLTVRWPLSRLRTRLAGGVARRTEASVEVCLECHDLIMDMHPTDHQRIPLFRLSADQEIAWLREFAGQPRNPLDTALIAADGWPALAARARRGDFGTAFQRRWLRYRRQMIAGLATLTRHHAMRDARGQRADVDFYY